MFCSLIVILAVVLRFVNSQQEYSLSECDLPWATECLDDFVDKLAHEPLEDFCNYANYTINVCLKDILTGQGCSEKYPRHSFYYMWLNPLNSVLNKFCALDSKQLTEYSSCVQEEFFNCLQLREDIKALGTTGMIELITTQMIPTTCSSIDLRTQICLQFNNNVRCRPFVEMILDLVKEFITASTCEEQPAILVPLSPETKPVSSKDELSSEADCSPELEILLKCFNPILELNEMMNTVSSSMHKFCFSAKRTLFCLDDILLNGCGENEQSIIHKNWLNILNITHREFCDPKYDSEQLESCWNEYYDCLKSSEGVQLIEDILFNAVIPNTCTFSSTLVDRMELCLVDTKLECQDVLEEIIYALRNKFSKSFSCNLNSMSDGNVNGASKICSNYMYFVSTLGFIILFVIDKKASLIVS